MVQFFKRRAVIAGWVLGLSACGGGGSSSPSVSVSFASPTATVLEGAAPLDVQLVLHTSLPALTEDAVVIVNDAGTGTATAASDYTTFAPHTVTFPADSLDGDVLAVPLTALDDHLVEGATETVRLGLSASSGASVSGPAAFTASITDIHHAMVEFTLPASTTPNEVTGPRSIGVVLELPSGVSLGTSANVRVTDAGTGSATPGSDYSSFTPITITFPSGSVDGASQSIAIQVLDDATVETDETVRLQIASLVASTTVGAKNIHQLTIADDDSPGSAALIASEGSSGVEHTLAYDDLVTLGTQTVGAGPNAGTRVRITNAGGSVMSLGAPRLIGTDPNDFAVELEAASSIPAGLVAPDVVAGPDMASPLVAESDRFGPGAGVRLDTTQLAEMELEADTTIYGVPVPGLGEVALELHRVPLPIANDAVFRIDGIAQPGGLRSALGDLSLWTGSVQGLANSRAFLALSSAGPRGFLDLGFPQDRIVHIVPDAASTTPGAPATARIVREGEMAAMGFGEPSDVCSDAREIPGASALTVPGLALDAPDTAAMVTVPECRLAIETDYQLYQKFGSTQATTTYVTELVAAVSDQYYRDVQTTLSIAYLGIYTTASDPWTSQDGGGTASNLLDEFRAAWAPNHWPVSATLAHFVSGANLGGGIAYVNALCNTTYGFGVSGNISGTINWGAWTGAPGSFTWDFVVVAHELGHNFGSNHTHSYCPPLDRCATNCSGTTVCTRGTIMSYCHVCGGMSNIDLQFHPVCANFMRQAINASCLGSSAMASGDYVQYLVRFNPLTATGTRNATLEFTHSAPNTTQPFHIRLQGDAN